MSSGVEFEPAVVSGLVRIISGHNSAIQKLHRFFKLMW